MAAAEDNELSRRIADLESQLAFQEDTIETLNQLLTRQSDLLHELQRKVTVLGERFQQVQEHSSTASTNPDDERPPHY
ncbi:SlyX family protein [Pseudidiomarina sp.]|uniref:SlyX family protein n=1 Tax=Pseudidiomarina sp. TaxID=2081707 RepID=UPI00299DC504|nr:SlyX family protein [Pseudidiomarina sp.]MDX1705338.1 SlyX family protein [Pseudidiomarina sp.]